MPYRALFGANELRAVERVFARAAERQRDFGYEGEFEEQYTAAFCRLQGGGCADAVATGTLAVWVAVQSLDLPPHSEVVVSPVTDPGSISPVILSGHRPVIADSAPGDFNVGVEQFEQALTERTRAAVLTHLGGYPLDMGPIMEVARRRGVRVIEDCSQAHGATVHGQPVGTSGDLAVFSTMFSKAHATGGCGGIVYTRDEQLYRRVKACADRGKPWGRGDLNPRDPATFDGPALNCNLGELSCAIGMSTLSRLEPTIKRRAELVARINAGIRGTRVLRPRVPRPDVLPFYFFHTLILDRAKVGVDKTAFADAVAAEGVDVNPDYRYVVAEWPWVHSHLARPAATPNAAAFRGTSFNLLFNEQYSDGDAADVVTALVKVAEAFSA